MGRRQGALRAALVLAMVWGAGGIYASWAGADSGIRAALRSFPATPQAVNAPADVVRAADGSVWVADAGNDRVQRFSPDGTLISTFVSDGSGIAFENPQAIAVDASGGVFVADTGNHRVVAINATGVVERVFGMFGSGSGQFRSPSGIAVTADGKIWVADTQNNRLQRFSSTGTFELTYGSLGSGAEQFSGPRGLAMGGNEIFVADAGNQRVAVVNGDGTWARSWGTDVYGSGAGTTYVYSRYSTPSDVCVVGTSVYVLDTAGVVEWVNQSGSWIPVFKYMIEVCTPEGAVVGGWGARGAGATQFISPSGIAADGSSVWIADSGNNRVLQHTAAGDFVQLWQAAGSGATELDSPGGAAMDGQGNTYVADSGNNRVQKYSLSGAHLGSIGSGVLSSPEGVAVDSSGNVFVADTDNNRVQKFSSGGTVLASFGSGVLSAPGGVALDGAGRVFVLDTGNHSVRVYDAGGALVLEWGGYGSGATQFKSPSGIAVSGSNVYVSDTGNSRISKFTVTTDVTPAGTWGSQGSTPGSFRAPAGVAIDAGGNVLVCDSGNDRIQEFTSAGVLVSYFGASGADLEEFHAPVGVAVGPSGVFVVAERDASRVQQFAVDYDPPVTRLSGIPEGWSNEVIVTLTATDDRGVARTSYRIGSGAIQIYSGPVGGLPEGQSMFYYSSVDLAGRAEATRTAVVLVDRTAPSTGSNLDGSWHRSPVSVALAPSDALAGVASTTYRVDGGTLFAYTGPFTVWGEGTRTLTYSSVDRAGNTEQVRNETLLIDDGAPQTGSNATGLWRGTPETLTLTATDARSGVDTISYRIGAVGPYRAYAEPFPVDGNGEIPVTFYATDIAGNVEQVRSTVVRVDRMAPVTIFAASDPRPDETRLVTLTPTDSGSGVGATYVSLNDTLPNPYSGPFAVSTVGDQVIEFWSEDALGNVELSQEVVIADDVTPPVTTAVGLDGAWRTTPAQFSLSATDTLAGVRDTYYRLDQSQAVTYTGEPVTVDTEGVTEVAYWSVDNRGIREPDGIGWVRIDRTAPESTAIVAPNSLGATATVTIDSSDAGSGVVRTEYRFGISGDWLTYSSALVVGAGDYLVQYRGVDVVGNEENPQSVSFSLRRPAPVTNSTIDAAWHAQDVYVGLTAYCEDPDAPITTYYRIGSGPVTPYSGPFAVTDEGEIQVRYWSEAGGISEDEHVEVVLIDRTPPTTTTSGLAGQWSNTHARVTLAPSDVGSEVDYTEYRLGGAGSWTWYGAPFSVTADGETLVEYRSVDNAGNTEDAKLGWVRIDRAKPVTTAAVTQRAAWLPAEVALSATDGGGSGLAGSEFRFSVSDSWSSYAATLTITAPGTTTVWFRSTDNAGNVEDQTSVTVTLAPSITSADSSLTFTPSDSTPNFGASFTLTGVLKNAAGAALSGQTIVFERATSTGWTSVGTAVTGTDGVASLSGVKPYDRAKTKYRACFAGTAAHTASTSASAYVNPHVYLTKGNAPWRYGVGTRKVTGYLKPRHATGSRTVLIYLYKKSSSTGKYVYKGRVRATISRHYWLSKYVVNLRFPSRGTWKYRAVMPTDSKHKRTYSAYDYARVR